MARGMVVALALHLWFPKWGAGSPKGTWSYCVVGAIRQINFNFLFCNFISFATDSTAGVNVFSTCGPVSELNGKMSRVKTRLNPAAHMTMERTKIFFLFFLFLNYKNTQLNMKDSMPERLK